MNMSYGPINDCGRTTVTVERTPQLATGTYITHTKFVTRAKCLSIGRLGGAGSRWMYMAEVKKRRQNKNFQNSDGV